MSFSPSVGVLCYIRGGGTINDSNLNADATPGLGCIGMGSQRRVLWNRACACGRPACRWRLLEQTGEGISNSAGRGNRNHPRHLRISPAPRRLCQQEVGRAGTMVAAVAGRRGAATSPADRLALVTGDADQRLGEPDGGYYRPPLASPKAGLRTHL